MGALLVTLALTAAPAAAQVVKKNGQGPTSSTSMGGHVSCRNSRWCFISNRWLVFPCRIRRGGRCRFEILLPELGLGDVSEQRIAH